MDLLLFLKGCGGELESWKVDSLALSKLFLRYSSHKPLHPELYPTQSLLGKAEPADSESSVNPASMESML